MGVVPNFFLFAVLPALAFKAGYVGTGWIFRTRGIPYPFEGFGALVGLGFFFCALGAAAWWTQVYKKGVIR